MVNGVLESRVTGNYDFKIFTFTMKCLYASPYLRTIEYKIKYEF